MENIPAHNLDTLLSGLLSKYNTMLDCPARFAGIYCGQKVQHFIEYIKSYKRLKCITDEQALHEFGYLLTEHAHTWWLRRKGHFTVWSEALTALQNQYGKQRPAFLVYKDIFQHRFEDYTTEVDFIDDKYELLAELPEPKLSERNKLDLIFALLPIAMQSKLEYVNISSVMELKDHILKLKCNANVNGSVEMKDTNNGSVANSTTKENVNGPGNRIQDTTKVTHCESITATTMTIIPTMCLNDKDPIIKVRRTADLMPHIKSEGNGESNLEQEEEFISTEHHDAAVRNQQQSHENSNFQIDVDIMNQINNIIDESEMNCEVHDDDGVADTTNNITITSIKSVKENPTTTIGFLLNGETTIHAELTKKSHPAVRAHQEKTNSRKYKIRCSYCRKYNHIAQECLKRTKHMQLFPEKFVLTSSNIAPSDDSKSNDSKNETTTNNSNVSTNNDAAVTVVTTTNESATSSAPPADVSIATSSFTTSSSSSATSIASILQQAIAASVAAPAPIISHSVSPVVATTFSHITTVPSSSPSTSTTSLTTKLIAPINGPCPSKILAAKLRNSNGPSPKCHQCGTVGFYKSICPNCSPIYNSSQYK